MYDRFRQIIDERSITPYKVAKDTGISQVTLSNWKTGIGQPKLDKLMKIAKYLNIALSELIEEEEKV